MKLRNTFNIVQPARGVDRTALVELVPNTERSHNRAIPGMLAQVVHNYSCSSSQLGPLLS